MKVLVITSAYPADASDARGIFVCRLSRALSREGVEVTVITPGVPSAPSKEIHDGVEVQRPVYWIPRWQRLATGLGGIVPNLRKKPWLIFQVPPLIAALTWRALRLGSGFDVIHSHWVYPGGIAGAIAAKRLRLPLVVTSHGGDLNLSRGSKILRALSSWVSRAADACVGVSRAMAEEFITLGVPPERVMFIPPGVDAANGLVAHGDETHAGYRRFVDFDGFRILYVGSLIPRKSVETLLEAHGELQRRGLRVACAIVGSGPARDGLRGLVRKNTLRNVVFVGPQPPEEVQQWMSAAHALVLPSLSEGRPAVMVEAMARGVPVVATDIPGSRELVLEGVTGMLFPPKNSRALADCIQKLEQDPALRQKMGKRGLERVRSEGLTIEQTAHRYISLYKMVCGSKASAAALSNR